MVRQVKNKNFDFAIEESKDPNPYNFYRRKYDINDPKITKDYQ